ncbi:MAG: metallophosphoesterase family protein [Lachnospiraceae bacterium]
MGKDKMNRKEMNRKAMNRAEEGLRGFRIMAASDLHYLSPQLMEYSGKFRELCEALGEPEMEQLEEWMEEWLNRVEEVKPDALLVTGDLSWQGEKLSHVQLAGKLDRLVRAGIPVYVVPGNQDLDNPFSACWKPKGGRDYTPAESVSPREFQEIYSSMGYGRAMEYESSIGYGKEMKHESSMACGSGVISRAPDSLSYQVCLSRPSGEMLYFFMLDTTIPGSSAGRITPGTFEWLEKRLGKIRQKSCLIAGHHPMLALNDTVSPYVLENGHELACLMRKYGAALYISGHLHQAGIVGNSQRKTGKKGKTERKRVLPEWMHRTTGKGNRQTLPVNIYLEKRGLRLL